MVASRFARSAGAGEDRAENQAAIVGRFRLARLRDNIGVVPFEILEHPADIGFLAFGRTLPEAFENAALALLSIRAEVEDVEPRQEFPILATGGDYESLLVNFLNEVLYL